MSQLQTAWRRCDLTWNGKTQGRFGPSKVSRERRTRRRQRREGRTRGSSPFRPTGRGNDARTDTAVCVNPAMSATNTHRKDGDDSTGEPRNPHIADGLMADPTRDRGLREGDAAQRSPNDYACRLAHQGADDQHPQPGRHRSNENGGKYKGLEPAARRARRAERGNGGVGLFEGRAETATSHEIQRRSKDAHRAVTCPAVVVQDERSAGDRPGLAQLAIEASE